MHVGKPVIAFAARERPTLDRCNLSLVAQSVVSMRRRFLLRRSVALMLSQSYPWRRCAVATHLTRAAAQRCFPARVEPISTPWLQQLADAVPAARHRVLDARLITRIAAAKRTRGDLRAIM